MQLLRYATRNDITTIMQTLYPAQEYTNRLGRFAKQGYEMRALTANDVSAIFWLARAWASEKMKRVGEITNPRTRTLEIDKIERYIDRVPSHYENLLGEPLTQLYGCFKDGELLAYAELEGNASFSTMRERFGLRRNSHSPQEFLDLKIFELLAQKGVTTIDRGSLLTSLDREPLMKYKQKFGSMELRSTTCLYEVGLARKKWFF
jgi:hypothetical protein